MIDKYLEHLTSKVNDKILQLQEAMADGNANDFAEYKKMCGEIKGLLTARSFILDLHERLNKNEDDEWKTWSYKSGRFNTTTAQRGWRES